MLVEELKGLAQVLFRPRPLLLGKRRVQLGGLIAEGAYAFVYEAKDIDSGEPLAVKKLVISSEEQRERAKLEIRVHGALAGVSNW